VTTPAVDPDNYLAALQAALAAERVARQEAEARASSAEAMVAYLKLLIAKMKRERFGQSAERGRQLLDQLELQLEESETTASESEAAEPAPARSTTVHSFTRKKPVRAPLPAHLPRERVVVPTPSACPCCGGKLVKMGEDITETLEVVPRQWKVVQTVREKFTCRTCEKITPPPAPFHVITRARAGASLLAMILYAKFGEHQPLNRQSQSFAREGIDLDTSTLADWVGACTASLAPLTELIRRHLLAAERLHGDDTTVPVLAKNKTVTARLWTLSEMTGRLLAQTRQRHCFTTRATGAANARSDILPITLESSRPMLTLAGEAVRRIDDIFATEREINGCSAEQRLAVRKTRIAPLVAALEGWMRAERTRLSRHAETAKAIDYMLKRWPAFTRFLDDGRICLSNNGTMPPSARCAVLPSAERRGCSRVLIGAASGQRRCTP
jgi:transposase